MSVTKAQLIGNAPLGSASAPTFTFADDPNTGIYSPGADQIALVTGGAGRLFIKASGDIGIRTDSPSGALDVRGNVLIGTRDASPVSIELGNGATGNRTVFIDFTGDTTYTDYGLRIERGSAGANTASTFYHRGTGNFEFNGVESAPFVFTHYLTERMRLDSSGRLGLGTSSPTGLLSLDNSTVSDIRLSVAGTLQGNFYASASDVNVFAVQANPVRFGTNNTERVRIDSSGRVGIGTTSPATLLHLQHADSTGSVFRLTRSSDSKRTFEIDYDNSTGAVTLGTVESFNSTTFNLAFKVAGSERARIDSSGRLLVGTSSARSVGTDNPSVLEVESTGAGLLSLVSNRADQYGAEIALGKSRGTAAGGIAVVQNNDAIGAIKFAVADGTDLISHCAAITAEIDGTPGANDTPGRLVFSTTADGASSPTERMRIGNDGRGYWYSTGINVLGLYSNKAAGTTDYLLLATSAATGIDSGTTRLLAFTNGNLQNSNNSYAGISDIKLKENIVDANSQWDDIKALQVRKYNFKEETGQQTHTQIGLIAQEVELVSPGLVSESPDRDAEGNDLGTVTKSVNYSVLYMKAVKALQEAMERIEVLEAKVNALEGN